MRTLILAALLVFLAGCTPAQTVCTADAKICPDGTAVGRTGPNCEFAPCQTENINSFEECKAAGYPIMESNPPQCRAGEKTFVQGS
ncbi:hypothetical protein JW968_02175 [Candidatus Woesearchaeota archaeon]|nr:hypothetical protein [Candidatus Woesearchaeota archaeon]